MNFIANIWPVAVADGYKDTILEELKKEGNIISVHEIPLNYRGLRNYMIQIYRHEKWSGSFFNHFRGIPAKLNPCYHPDTPMFLVEFEGKDVESVLACKERIRKLCKHEKHSMHTSDTPEEYYLMKKILLHAPTIELMNTVDLDKNRGFTKVFSRFLKMLRKYQLNPKDFLIVSEASKSLFGLQSGCFRKCKFSWVTRTKIKLPPKAEAFNQNEFQPVMEQFTQDIYDTRNHISYCGITFVHPDIIQKMTQQMSNYSSASEL